MEFLKKNYEKIVLGVVLVVLTIGVGLLPVFINAEKSKLAELSDKRLRLKVPELPPPPMTNQTAALERLASGERWNFTRDHNLFNPMAWQREPGGKLVKLRPGKELFGPSALEIVRITPLYLKLTYNGTSGSGYLVGFSNEAAGRGVPRSGERLVSPDDKKKDIFTLKNVVTGASNAATGLVLEMNDESHDSVTIGPGQPYLRVEGYKADLKYPPDNNRQFNNQIKGASLPLSGVVYKIVAITTNSVIVSAPNDKKTAIFFDAVPSNAP